MLKRLLPIIISIPFLSSCDNIDEDDRYIDTGSVNVERKVLLEEFTGQRCTNCPAAHKIIESLEEQYGEDLIVVSIHAGSFGISTEDGGLMQKEGNEYADHWDITAYPAGVIDRTSGVLTMNQWATVVREDAMLSTEIQISLEAQLSGDKKELEIFTTIASSEDTTGSLQLWVVESGIVAFQIDGRDRLDDYVHNNVFRACVNGLWGEEMPLERNVVKYVSNTIDINSEWNLQNVSIVGFYYNNSGVLQVEKCNIEDLK